jgi:hypothetical protein
MLQSLSGFTKNALRVLLPGWRTPVLSHQLLHKGEKYFSVPMLVPLLIVASIELESDLYRFPGARK